MMIDDPEPWWEEQNADSAWIARQEAINDARAELKGKLADAAGKSFPLQICRSAAGYYIGRLDEEGFPFSRESEEYWRKAEQAQAAFDCGSWTRKPNP